VPCLLANVHSGFESALKVCAKREQDIQLALDNGDVLCLKRYSGGMDTARFDFKSPEKSSKDVEKLTDAANATRKRMKDEIGAWKQTLEKRRAAVNSLEMQKEMEKLEKRRLERKEEVSAASRKIEELTDKDAMKKGRKAVLVNAGVKGAEKMDADELSKACAKLKTQRFQHREEVAVQAAAAVLPDAAIQQKVRDITEAKAAMQQLLARVTDQLTEQEKNAAGQREEAQAMVQLLEEARTGLDQQIGKRVLEEEDLIEEEAAARMKLEELLKELPKAVEDYDKAKAKRGFARVKIDELRRDEEKLAARVKKVREAADEADQDCEAWAMEAADQREELQSAIKEAVEVFDAQALGPVQMAVANCKTAAALLMRIIADGELEERSWTGQIEEKQQEADILEHAIDDEDCEDQEMSTEKFGSLVDEVADLKEKLGGCQTRLESLRKQKYAAEECVAQLLSLDLPVQQEEAEKTGQEVVTSAYRGRALHAQTKAASTGNVASDALVAVDPMGASGLKVPAKYLQQLVAKQVEQKMADMMIQAQRAEVCSEASTDD